MDPEMNGNVLVLLSGGVDSSACVAFYGSHRYRVSALNVNYGQLSAVEESRAASAISCHFGIPLKSVAYQRQGLWPEGEIAGRNAFLLMIALLEFQHESGIIALGIHSGTQYRDCSEAFIRHMQGLLDLYKDGRVIIGAPFVSWSKVDIWGYCRERKVPINLTYSCELGKKRPCGGCLSCRDLEALIASEKPRH